VNSQHELACYYQAETIAPTALEWLQATSSARVLHLFDYGINFINQSKGILSVVTQEVGPGPLSIVLSSKNGRPGELRERLAPSDTVTVENGILIAGCCSIETTNAAPWEPVPNWHLLSQGQLFHGLAIVEFILRKFAPKESLARVFRGGNLNDWQAAVHEVWSNCSIHNGESAGGSLIHVGEQLAGLGQGLTPAGDDFLMGICYALFAFRNPPVWRICAERIGEVASKVTSSLSGAWLIAAGRGEASLIWHRLVDSLIVADDRSIASLTLGITKIGHTSGADSLTGFVLALKSLQSLTVR